MLELLLEQRPAGPFGENFDFPALHSLWRAGNPRWQRILDLFFAATRFSGSNKARSSRFHSLSPRLEPKILQLVHSETCNL